MTLYPRIYFACHTRHVRDPQSQRLLSRHQASILDHLDELEPTTVMELAGHMGVTPATMSLAIDRLERKGYVVRLKDAKDRRRVHVRLRSAASACARRIPFSTRAASSARRASDRR
jgi:DNA-binding MarR family transcriptional regulator